MNAGCFRDSDKTPITVKQINFFSLANQLSSSWITHQSTKFWIPLPSPPPSAGTFYPCTQAFTVSAEWVSVMEDCHFNLWLFGLNVAHYCALEFGGLPPITWNAKKLYAFDYKPVMIWITADNWCLVFVFNACIFSFAMAEEPLYMHVEAYNRDIGLRLEQCQLECRKNLWRERSIMAPVECEVLRKTLDSSF